MTSDGSAERLCGPGTHGLCQMLSHFILQGPKQISPSVPGEEAAAEGVWRSAVCASSLAYQSLGWPGPPDCRLRSQQQTEPVSTHFLFQLSPGSAVPRRKNRRREASRKPAESRLLLLAQHFSKLELGVDVPGILYLRCLEIWGRKEGIHRPSRVWGKSLSSALREPPSQAQ